MTTPAPPLPPADAPPVTVTVTAPQPPPAVIRPTDSPPVVVLAPTSPGPAARETESPAKATPAPAAGAEPTTTVQVPVATPVRPPAVSSERDAAARTTVRPSVGFRAVSVSRLGRRGALALRYRLAAPARLLLLIRGRGPRCRLIDEIPVRGRVGLNTVVFGGRLPAGTYLLSPRRTRRGADLARVLLRIVPGRRSGVPLARPDCGPPRSPTLVAAGFTVSAPATAPRAGAPARPRSVRATTAAGVLDAAVPALGPSAAASDEAAARPGTLAVTLGVGVLLSLIGMFVVVRRERRPQAVEVLPRGHRPREPGRWVPTELAVRGPDAPERYEPVVECEPFDSVRASRRLGRR